MTRSPIPFRGFRIPAEVIEYMQPLMRSCRDVDAGAATLEPAS